MIYISQLLETPELMELLRTHKVGLEVISFSIGYVLDDLEGSTIHYQEEFKEVIKEGIPLSFHGAFLDLLPGSCDPKVRALALERMEASYEAARSFGVDKMVFHMGYVPNTYPDQYWLENTIDFWKIFLQDKLEVCHFYIENVLDEYGTLQKQLIDAIDHPHFKACLDIGHAQAFSKQSVLEWVEELGNRIGYVHMHNNDGTRDAHDSLLKGIMPIEDVARKLKEQAPEAHWCLEISQREALEESLKWLKERV